MQIYFHTDYKGSVENTAGASR